MKFVCIVVCSLLVVAQADALEVSQLPELRKTVIEMCRGGTTSGSSSRFEVIGNAQGSVVVLKGLAKGGADAKVQFTKEEWDGIKVLQNPDTYSQCVTSTLDALLKKL